MSQPKPVHETLRGPLPAGVQDTRAKSVTLALTYSRIGDDYEIKSITNSAVYKPGDWLHPDVVAQLCALPNWTVSMVEPDYLSLLQKLPLPLPI